MSASVHEMVLSLLYYGFISSLNSTSILSQNSEGCGGGGFWLWARRRDLSIPGAGCKGRAHATHGQKPRRPKGFRSKGRLASLLPGRRPMNGMGSSSPASWFPKKYLCAVASGSLSCRASPSSLQNENSTLGIFRPALNVDVSVVHVTSSGLTPTVPF